MLKLPFANDSLDVVLEQYLGPERNPQHVRARLKEIAYEQVEFFLRQQRLDGPLHLRATVLEDRVVVFRQQCPADLQEEGERPPWKFRARAP